MTLREFTKQEKLNLKPYDRAKIGNRLRWIKSDYTYKQEYDYMVRDYKTGFFDRTDVQKIILNYMING